MQQATIMTGQLKRPDKVTLRPIRTRALSSMETSAGVNIPSTDRAHPEITTCAAEQSERVAKKEYKLDRR